MKYNSAMDVGYVNEDGDTDDMMDGEGGQLKTKNGGQKYVINHQPSQGYFVTRKCALLLSAIAAMVLAAVIILAICLIVSPRCTASEESGRQMAAEPNATVLAAGMIGAEIISTTPHRGRDDVTTRASPLPVKTVPISDSSDVETPEVVAADEALVGLEEEETDIVVAEGWSPLKYRLIIEPNFATSTNNGSVWIEIVVDESHMLLHALPPIVLDINNINIIEANVYEISVVDNRTIQVPSDSFYGKRNETYEIALHKAYEPDELRTLRFTVYILFESKLSDTLQGIYRTRYRNDIDEDETWLASTQFSPIDARRAFPCFDRPDKKAVFEISVVRAEDKPMALSNMPSLSVELSRPGFVRVNFAETPKMSTYLVAFIVSDLVQSDLTPTVADGDNRAPTIRVWTRKEVADMTRYAFRVTGKILPFLERYFDNVFKLPKLDLVAVPDFGFSAMENWGLITFRESALLVPDDADKHSSSSHTRRVADVIAHELAHQWMGNLVTMKQWQDLWLKEGFATYISYLCVNYIEPSWNVLDTFPINELRESMEKDGDITSHPISFNITKLSDIRRIFDPISYSKGASIIRMMNSFIGEQTFVTALRRYVQEFAYGNAVQDDLWAIMTRTAHADHTLDAAMNIKEIMETWTLQAGYPVINVVRDGTNLKISQYRYMLPKINENDTTRWYVPISMAKKSDKNVTTAPVLWLSNKMTEVVMENAIAPDEWVYLNINRTGYYRVNYDYKSWALLGKNYLNLSSPIRAQLLDDALSLARAEIVGYDIPLTFLVHLVRNGNDVLSWTVADKGLEYITQMLSREAAYEPFKAFMRYISKHAFAQLGLHGMDNETHVERLHRSRIVKSACFFGNDYCVNGAQMQFRTWMQNPRENNISPDLKNTIYCTALREGGIPEWNFAYKNYKKTTSASEKEVLLNALGCTTKPWLLSKYLNLTISGSNEVRKQDGYRAFSTVARNSIGHELALEFLTENIADIAAYYGDGFSTISKMVDSITTFMNKAVHLEQLDRFAQQAKKHGLKDIESTIQLATEHVRNNIFWRSRSYYKLQTFLEKIISDLQIINF